MNYILIVQLYGEVNGGEGLDKATQVNPISYATELMERFPLLSDELEKYQNLSTLDYKDRPRYDWYVTEENGIKVFHITHYNPNLGENSSQPKYYLKIQHKTSSSDITWGTGQTDTNNLVVDWNPDVDTRYYLIRRASFLRLGKYT